jgi:pentapeptide MXKDX repeat protein
VAPESWSHFLELSSGSHLIIRLGVNNWLNNPISNTRAALLKEINMKSRNILGLFAGFLLVASLAACTSQPAAETPSPASSAQPADAMKDDAMKDDAMKNGDAMKDDAMKDDAMKNGDAMKDDAMKGDAMKASPSPTTSP